MDLAVVVVSWNVCDLLARCLRSVEASLADSGLSWHIVVADNASTDGTPEMVQRQFPEVELILLPENRGFAAGSNAGVRAVLARTPTVSAAPEEGTGGTAPLILLLNADAEVVGPALPEMAAYLAAHPNVAVVGPQLRFADGTVQSSRRRFPSMATLLWESTPLEQLWPGNPWVRQYRLLDCPDDVEQDVDWLVGACLLLRAEAIVQAGLLDERYFLYFEELEWCQRIRRAGWRIVYLPTVQVIHHEGRSSEQVPLQRHLAFQRSKLRYARRAFGALPAGLLRWSLLALYGGQFLVEWVKYLLGHKRPLRQERMRIYAAVLRDRLPPPGREDGPR